MTETQIRALWLYTADIWGQFQIPGDTDRRRAKMLVWMDQLADIDAGKARAAIASMGEREFPPTPGQIRAAALAAASGLPDPDEAWAEVLGQISRVGWCGTPAWSHPAIEAAAAAMGRWVDLCASEDLMADRAHFMRLYGHAQARHRTETITPPWAKDALAPPARPALPEPEAAAALPEPEPAARQAGAPALLRELAARLRVQKAAE